MRNKMHVGPREASRKDRGYLLITSYLLLSVLSIFSLALFSRAYVFYNSSERNRNNIVAFNMAEAGIDRAIVSLSSNANYAGTAGYITFGTNSGFDVSVCPPTCPAGMSAPTLANYRMIQSNGYAPGNVNTARGYEMRPVSTYVELDTTPFNYAAFADSNMVLNGTITVDSYDSRVGNYGGGNVGSQGDVASDGTISLIGHPLVNGAIVEVPGINCGPASTAAASSGSLSINGNTDHQLAAGTYHFSSISISGNGKLTLLGPVTIYVDGNVSIGGNGVATASNNPANLMIYSTQANSISIGGNGSFYGGVYAPTSTVAFTGNGDMYGAVMAQSYQQSGTNSLHFDVALKEVTGPCVDVNVKSWRETNTSAA